MGETDICSMCGNDAVIKVICSECESEEEHCDCERKVK